MTMANPTVVDAVASYAHRVGEDIHVILRLPHSTVSGLTVPVRFRGRAGHCRAEATVVPSDPGVVLEVTVPAHMLGEDLWRLAMQPSPDEEFVRLQTRLLTSRHQPTALLPGPVPQTRMSPPRPSGSRGLREAVPSPIRNVLGRAKRRTQRLMSSGHHG